MYRKEAARLFAQLFRALLGIPLQKPRNERLQVIVYKELLFFQFGYEPRGRGFDSCQPHQNLCSKSRA
jgi:hypothetical protein